MLSSARLSVVAGSICLCLVLAGPGCRSLGGPNSASFASVTISNHTPQEIAQATAQVFAADGYRGRAEASGQLVFEKEASRATSMSRSGVIPTYEGARTVIRVRVDLTPAPEGAQRLHCQAFTVTGAGDSFFEDEVRLTNMRSAPYQALLNKVKAQLK